MSIPIKYSTIAVDNTIKTNNIVLGTKTKDYGPTSSSGFYVGIDPPASGYTIYQVFGEGQQPKAVVANNDQECIWFARSFGGTNINTIEDAINFFITGSTGTTIVNMDYPNIVTSGLTFSYDAGFIASYPRSGINCYDISGNNKNATSGAFPAFSNDTIDSFLFNGTSHTLNSLSITTPYLTIELWVKTDISNVDGVTKLAQFIIGREGMFRIMGGGANSGITYSVAIRTTGNAWYSAGTTCGVTGLTTSDDWSHVVATYDGSYIKMYLNGEFQGIGDQQLSGTIATQSGVCSISYGLVGNLAFFKGNMAIARIYNRGLSATEVLQNYNALKSRFGL